jgi:hypothetical protein
LVVCVRLVTGAEELVPLVRGDDTRPTGVAGLAGVAGCHPCRDGIDRGVLEGAVLHALGRLRGVAGDATHLKHVPGRKTDVIDVRWIAEVLSFGLLRPSLFRLDLFGNCGT